MDSTALGAWFDEYLDAFAACGRHESGDPRALLRYFEVPLLLATDNGALALSTEEDVIAALRRQIAEARASEFDHSEMISSEVVAINGACALHVAEFSRQRADGSEIARLKVTYVITLGPAGHRISALAVHSPPRA